MKQHYKTLALSLFVFLLILPTSMFAKGETIDYISDAYYYLFGFIIIATIIFLFMVDLSDGKKEEKKVNLWHLFRQGLTDSKPIEEEHEILLHHDYDGIQELDNNLPPWWKWLFYSTIIFAVVYLFFFHIAGGPGSDQEYLSEVQEAQKTMAEYKLVNNVVSAESAQFLSDIGTLSAGKEIFTKHCVACHLDDGGGSVGPNLTDNYWIHGNNPKDLFLVISNGVPEKGMISWKSQLSPNQIQEVASYVRSLKGTSPKVPKAPQGILVDSTATQIN